MSILVVCPSCHRHLRTSETACPFCGADVRRAVADAAPRPMPRERLGRTAMLAFAAVNLGVAACGGDVAVPAPVDGSTNSGGAAETGGASSTGGVNSAGAGGRNVFTGGAPSTGGVLSTGGEFCCPPYGLPPPIDTGGTSNAGGAGTAGSPALGTGGSAGNSGGMMPVPIYGAPPAPAD